MTRLEALEAAEAIRDAAVTLVENTPSPGEADETESGHRYAQGFRDASNYAAEQLDRLAKAIAAIPLPPATEPEPVGEVVEVAVHVRLTDDRTAYIASGIGALDGRWTEPARGNTIATIRARVPLPRVPEVNAEVEQR